MRKSFANSRPLASNFKTFSRSLEQFFLTVGQNNFSNKIPISLFTTHNNLFFLLFTILAKSHFLVFLVSCIVSSFFTFCFETSMHFLFEYGIFQTASLFELHGIITFSILVHIKKEKKSISY